jgi:general secretion pathway protein D
MTPTMLRLRIFLMVPSVILAAACSNVPPRSIQSLPPVERAALETTRQAAADESVKLSEHNDLLRASIERVQPLPLPPAPVAPRYDPMENRVVSVNMHEATISQLLWALANQLEMSLVVDPRVLDLPKRASLYLKRVSAREVFRQIMNTFDLHGSVEGRVMHVSPIQEKTFALDILSGTTTVSVSTGGDVFGSSGGSASGNSLRGNLTLSGEVGEKSDPYEQLSKAIESILAEETSQGSGPKIEKGRFSLDRTSGTLLVSARPSRIAAIDTLIRNNKRTRQRQVQVEAQIIDIQLSDGFQFGIDWTALGRNIAGHFGTGAISVDPLSGAQPGLRLVPRNITVPGASIGGTAAAAGGGLGFSNSTFSATLNALRTFGAIKVLSNPTVRVRNGVPAYLSVGSNIRYVSKLTTSFSNTGGGASNTSSDVQTDSLFSGVVIGVAPFIHEDGRVELFVHPMQTEVEPQSLELRDVGHGNRVTLPVVNTKGITTMLNLRDGDTVIIGGLIDQAQADQHQALPGLSDVPALGKLFDKTSNSHQSRELVVILRVRTL